MFNSPLEQFEISALIPIRFGNFDISFTNSSLFAVIAVFLIFMLLLSTIFNSKLVPQKYQAFMEMLYEFILNLVNENIVGKNSQKYFPFLFTLFMFILFCNVIGIVPYSFTVTSHIIITFAIALSLWLGVTIIGIWTHKFHYFSLFFPQGTPLYMAPLLVAIEILSYLSRPISLSVRLFANMMAGHSLLKIIGGFGWAMLTAGGFIAATSIIPVAFLVVLMGLELGIACLQAYVFTVLVCLYINEAYNLH